MYFNWLPTESDYKSYYRAAKEKKEQNDPTILMEWEPRWYILCIISNICTTLCMWSARMIY